MTTENSSFYSDEELFHAMQVRKSTRTYNGVELKPEHLRLIQNYLKDETQMKGPFGDTFRIEFMNDVDIDEQIATYGYIKEFNAVLMAISTPEPSALFEMAYVLHGLVLQLTEAGVQTVWLGGAFNHKDAINISDMNENEIIAAVIPMGYESSKKRLLFDYIAPVILGAKHRKRVDDVYFSNDFQTPFTDNSSKYYEALDVARRAPSAKNKQSWRVVVDEENKSLHLYAFFSLRDEVGTGRKQYACPPEYLDLGAYFRTLELALIHKGLEGKVIIQNLSIEIPQELDIEYIASWIQN